MSEIVLGNANGAGEDNRNVARMAGLLAGLPVSVPATTVNRLCGSSLDAVIVASRQIALGEADVVVAGGVESMSRAPWVLPKPDRPFPASDAALVSTTLGWRLVNPSMPTEWTITLGEATEQVREQKQVTRAEQDEFALRSHQAAAAAWNAGFYDDQVVPVPGVNLARDESIRPGHHAGETCSAQVGVPGRRHSHRGEPLAAQRWRLCGPARHRSRGRHAGPGAAGPRSRPRHRCERPAVLRVRTSRGGQRALKRAGIGWGDVSVVELNEAFAAQSVACVKAWDIDPAIVNTRGGAIAIGHPLGASGTRILGTLARTLTKTGERWGVAAICIGVGQGSPWCSRTPGTPHEPSHVLR